jgi:hypothetical protein
VTRVRVLLASAIALLGSLALAAPAFANKGAEGLYGKANDKVITNFGFGLMILFTLLVVLLSAAQGILNKRRGK